MKKRAFTRGLTGVLFFFSMMGPIAGAGEREKYVFKIATVAPEQSVWMQTYRRLDREVRKASGGAVRLKCYPGGVQGDEKTVLRKIRIGQLQGAGFMGTGLAMICPDSQVLQLPAVFRDEEELDAVFAKMEPLLRAQCQKRGYVVLGWPHLGFGYLFSRDLVAGLEGLRHARPWQIQNDPITRRFFQTGKVSAISANVGDVLPSLDSGLIQSVISPPVGMVSLQWYTRVRYRLDLRIAYSFGAFVVSERRWKQMPPALQKQVREIAERHIKKLNIQVRQQNIDAIKAMEKRHIKTVRPSKKTIHEFEQLSRQVGDALAGSLYSRVALEKMRSSLAAYRRSQKK